MTKYKKHVSSSPHAYIILFTWHLNFNWHIVSKIWVNVLSSLNFLSIRIWYSYTCKNVKMFNHFSLTCWKREHAIFFTYIFGQNIFKRFDNFTKFAKSILTVTWPHFLLTLPNAFKRSLEPKQFLCCFKLFIHIHVNHIGIKLSTVQCPQCMPPFSLILANPATTWWTSILSSIVFFLLAWQILLNIHLSKYHWLIC